MGEECNGEQQDEMKLLALKAGMLEDKEVK